MHISVTCSPTFTECEDRRGVNSIFSGCVSMGKNTRKESKSGKKTFISDCLHVLEGGGGGQEFGVSCVIKSQ